MLTQVRPVRSACVAFLVALLGCLTLLVSGARAGTVTVSSQPIGPPINGGFLGISITYPSLAQFTGTDPDHISPAFLNLMQDIGPGQKPVLRIGAESGDASWVPTPGLKKPAGVSYAITPAWMKLARATAAGMHGQLLLGLNLEASDKQLAVDEARAMLAHIGAPNILALEIGNEPELYHHFAWYHTPSGGRVLGRGANWSLPLYRAQFTQFADAMPSGFTIAGPTSGLGAWVQQLPTFLHDEPKVGLATIHAYPLKHCSASHIVTIPDVLADSVSAGFVEKVAPLVADAHAAGKQVRIDEMNAISCGGTSGVSNSFASAIWMMNTLFGLDRIGANGINLNVPMNSINSVIAPEPASGGQIQFHVQPEYYAMMMFAHAAPPGSQVLAVHADEPYTLATWATRAANGAVRVVLVNKSATSSTPATVNVPGGAGPAAIEQLHADSLASTSDVTLGGQTLGYETSTGLLTGAPQQQALTPVAGSYTVSVPPASIEMLTFRPQPGALLLSALRSHGLLKTLLPSW